MPFLDPLLCHEEHLELYHDQQQDQVTTPTQPIHGDDTFLEQCSSLLAKESDPQLHLHLPQVFYDSRKEPVAWMLRAASHHAFSSLTALLAVDYLDRFFLPPRCGGARWNHVDKPWTRRLAAVACLSLAAKVEETHVPLLVDLQLHDDFAGYVFDEKTVRRMELLVLSSLDWRMNPVTPLSFIQILLPLLSPKRGSVDHTATATAIKLRLQSCEAILTSFLPDPRWVKYSPSVWAAAALLHTSECDETHDLISFLNVPKDKMEECCQLIEEYMGSNNGGRVGICNKRKHWLSSSTDHFSPPPSPDGVITSCFSYESSSDSWGPDHHGPFKRQYWVGGEIFGDDETREGWGL